jgi:hypothetical protein
MENLTNIIAAAQITLFAAFLFNIGRLILSLTIKSK